MQIKYDYDKSPTVKNFAASDKFIRGLMGPIGSGKSTACIVEIISRSLRQKPSKDGIRRTRWAVIRNTYTQLKDTTIKTFMQWVPQEFFGIWKETTHTYIISDNKNYHIEILFRALDRPDQVKNLLSLELTGAFVNEAREIPWEIIQALQGRVGRFPAKKDGGASWFGVFMDTNPPDTDSWWYNLFEEKRPVNAQIFKQPSGLSIEAENIHNLPKDYYENLTYSLSVEQQKIYIEGKYGSIFSGKAVYPEYNDQIHCREFNLMSDLPIYRGWDFGLTPACIFSQITPSGKWLIYDEMTADNMAIERFSENVIIYSNNKMPNFEFIDIGDPAGNQRVQTDEKTCFEILHAKNINIQPGNQDPNIRIESVKKSLNSLAHGDSCFNLHPNCKTLRKGFLGGYQYKKISNKKDIYIKKPDKNKFSHVHDALQYVATTLFANKIKNPATINNNLNHNITNPWNI